jgi:hypothetical protein
VTEEDLKTTSFMVMGDGGLYRVGRCTNVKFIMNMVKDNQDYIHLVKDALEKVVPARIHNRKDYNTDGHVRREQFRLESRTSEVLTEMHKRVYRSGYKGLDAKYIKDIGWKDLAILYMCDGCGNKYLRPEIGMVNPSCSVTLNMKRLNMEDQLLLADSIQNNLGIKFKIHRHGKFLYLSLGTKDVNKFMDGIEPHVCDSFKYKIVRMDNKE